jgi:hypothetical protein
MSFDLSELLQDWPYEPGQLQVRRIHGEDGRSKLQLRLDMGVLQMEETGRPDGRMIEGHESLLEHHQARVKEGHLELTADEIGDLQVEGVQYYHRYLAFFQLNDWQSVARDTKRNLDMFNFVVKHAPNEELAWSVEQFRPYVLTHGLRHISLLINKTQSRPSRLLRKASAVLKNVSKIPKRKRAKARMWQV